MTLPNTQNKKSKTDQAAISMEDSYQTENTLNRAALRKLSVFEENTEKHFNTLTEKEMEAILKKVNKFLS